MTSPSDAERPFKREPAKRGAATGPARPPVSLDECPVTCLGTANGVYYFLSPSGELRVLHAKDFRRVVLISLFDGWVDWCHAVAPAPKDGWSIDLVAEILMRRCVDAGMFDPERAVHGLGVWPDDASATPSVIVHCGDKVRIGQAWEAPGFRHGGALYARSIPIDRPDFESMVGTDAGQGLLDAAGCWAFHNPAELQIIVGYIASAMLGAAAPWRAHLYNRAPRGRGKSMLADLVKAALGGQKVDANNFTEASLRHALTDGARAIVLDEAEGGEGGTGGRVASVIELLRQMSGGKGAEVMRGGKDGTARRYSVTGAAYLSAIIGVPLRPQDKSRITEIRLAGPAPGSTAERAKAAIQWAAKNSPRLRARMAQQYPLYLKAIQIYRRAIIADGGDPRQADQWAAFLAGLCALTQDSVDAEAARADLEPFREMIADARAADEDDSEAARCLAHMFSAPAESWSGGDRRTVGQAVMEAREGPEVNGPRLHAYGLRLDWTDPDMPALLVANGHQGLERIFAGTDWTQGRWRIALAELDGATAHGTESYAGAKSRGLRVPVKHLPRPKDLLPDPRPQREGEPAPKDED